MNWMNLENKIFFVKFFITVFLINSFASSSKMIENSNQQCGQNNNCLFQPKFIDYTTSRLSPPSSETGSEIVSISRERSGQYIGSVLKTSLDDDEGVIYDTNRGTQSTIPSTKKASSEIVGHNVLTTGYKVITSPKQVFYKYPRNNINNYVKYAQPLKSFDLKERYHPTTFEAGEIINAAGTAENIGEVIQAKPSQTFENEVTLQHAHDFSNNFHEHEFGNGNIEFGYDYGYPYSGYPQPLPHITTEIPVPTGKQQETNFGYYYIGRKLWYIPLYFSIYFVLYVGALIIKAIAKHKIFFPSNLATAVTGRFGPLKPLSPFDINLATETILKAIEKYG